MSMQFPIERFRGQSTPFYYYDLDLLDRTLRAVTEASGYPGFKVHYAMKANANPAVIQRIARAGLGVDAVSGGEVEAALLNGFSAGKCLPALERQMQR